MFPKCFDSEAANRPRREVTWSVVWDEGQELTGMDCGGTAASRPLGFYRSTGIAMAKWKFSPGCRAGSHRSVLLDQALLAFFGFCSEPLALFEFLLLGGRRIGHSVSLWVTLGQVVNFPFTPLL